MTTREVSAIALKILSIWLLLQLLLSCLKLVGVYHALGEKVFLIHEVGLIGGLTLVGFFMVFLVWRLSNSVLRGTRSKGSVAPLMESLAIQLLGLYLVITTLGDIPLALLYTYKGEASEINRYAYLTGRVVQLIFGLVLLTRSLYWHSLLLKMRGEGEPP